MNICISLNVAINSPIETGCHNDNLIVKRVTENCTGPLVSFEAKNQKVFKKAHFFKKKRVKKRFSYLKIKLLKYADRLKDTPCDQS